MSTGYVAKILGVPEPRINQQVRRGLITPAPPVISGRRVWELDQVQQVAKLLGVPLEPEEIRLEVLNLTGLGVQPGRTLNSDGAEGSVA